MCHTLVGGALAQAGLKERTALGTATLLIGTNLPDVDILAGLWEPGYAFWFRRGVTHGVLAWLVLPVVLTGVVLVWDRAVRRRGGRVPARAVAPFQLWLLALIAVLTHPLLDFLNTYGMRFLAPFSFRWFYGDTLFIVDPWVWAMLTAGIFLAWKRRQAGDRGNPAGHPARVALAAVVGYIAVMGLANVTGRAVVTRSLVAAGYAEPQRLMVAPVAVNPFRRWVVAQDGDVYRFGRLAFLRRPMFALEPYTYPAEPRSYAAVAAVRGPVARRFQSWARFPYYVADRENGSDIVLIGDARYTLDPASSWAAVRIELGGNE